MFTTEEADSTVQALLERAYWADQDATAFSVVAKLARYMSSRVRRQAAADIVETTFTKGEVSEMQLEALGALLAASTPGDITGHARSYASLVHAGQVDKLGKPYMEHLEAVAGGVTASNSLAVQVAWLHDALEDTEASAEVIEVLIGEEGLAAVKALTHMPHEPRARYYERVRSNPTALVVKLADVAHNSDPQRLAFLDQSTRERLAKKYATAREALSA